MKFYSQSKGGITKQLLECSPEDEFFISGPVSKGLNLKVENIIDGNTVIFVGGTGILPFVDFFAYLARRLINEKCPEYNIYSEESFDSYMHDANFVVYAYFPSSEQSVGLKLCQDINNLHISYGVENRFRFIPKFTKFGDKRLDKSEMVTILKKLNEYKRIKNIWVCGPPSMNNMFQRHRRGLLKEFELNSNQIDIL